MDSAKSIERFFNCMGIAVILSAVNTNLSNIQTIDVVKNVSTTFAFNFIVGIPCGLSWMFGIDLYLLIKKHTIK